MGKGTGGDWGSPSSWNGREREVREAVGNISDCHAV